MVSIIKSLLGYKNINTSNTFSELENKLEHFKNVLELVPQKETRISNQNYDTTCALIANVKNFCERNLNPKNKIIVSLSG